MRLNHLAAAVLLYVVVGAFAPRQTPALDGTATCSGGGPCIELIAKHDDSAVRVHASTAADPTIPGLLQIDILLTTTSQQATHFIPIAFDAAGEFVVDIPLSAFAIFGNEAAISFKLYTVGLPGGAPYEVSMQWTLLIDDYLVGDANNPPPQNYPLSPQGGMDLRPLTGTEAPLFPYSWSVVGGEGYPGNAVHHLVLFGCAPGGPAGSFPIN